MSDLVTPIVEQIIALGFSTTLREYDAECDLRDQYEAARLRRALDGTKEP